MGNPFAKFSKVRKVHVGFTKIPKDFGLGKSLILRIFGPAIQFREASQWGFMHCYAPLCIEMDKITPYELGSWERKDSCCCSTEAVGFLGKERVKRLGFRMAMGRVRLGLNRTHPPAPPMVEAGLVTGLIGFGVDLDSDPSLVRWCQSFMWCGFQLPTSEALF